ncbi:MAG: type II secretion system F family protein [Patescibacteria group bacterium]
MEFQYKAKTLEGKVVKDTIEAINEQAAIEALTEQGLILLSLVEKGKRGLTMEIRLPFFERVRSKDMVLFSRQLAVMVSAGLPLVKALEVSTKQTTNKTLKKILSEVTDNVRGGARLSSSLAKYPEVFNDFYINMIRTGETSGKLDEVLNYLADEVEKNYDLMSKIKGAMIYPIFILVAVAGAMFIMMAFVIPKLVTVLIEAQVALPLPTIIMISVAKFFSNYWQYILIFLIILIFIIRVLIKRTRRGRLLWDFAKLKIPVLGDLFQKIYLVRFTRSLSTLIVGGIPLNAALKIVADVVANAVYRDLVLQTMKAVEDGYSISTIFMRSKEVPQMLSQIMIVGEQTGQLDSVLDRMANFYAREVENTLGKLTTLLEPVIIIFLGIIVGGMVAAIVMPMYNLASAIK